MMMLRIRQCSVQTREETMDVPSPKKKARTASSWKQKCIDAFELQPVPARKGTASQKALSELDVEEMWKRYYEFRIQANRDEEEEESYDDDDNGDKELLQKMQEDVKDLAAELDCPWWTQHMKMRVTEAVWEECDELRTLTVHSYIFSPYQIPHAVQLEHRFHYRARMSSIEFFCSWNFSLLHLKDYTPQPCYADEELEVLCSNGFKDPPYLEGHDDL
jgi:hypothetical protein